ncbi:MAG: response regulator transcription factor, partial [Saprospiraceae bacterium]|nr:response regulator transcription factor [Saprospiraceae bacterium]
QKPEPVALPLTNRELELLTLLSKGLLYKEIGEQMNITIGTVNQHILKIYDKLEVTNKTEAINKLNTNRGQ